VKTVNEMLAADSSHKEWIPLLELATREVFEMMLGCKLAQPEIAVDESFDITAMVGLAGQMCGVLTVRCAAKSATHMASKMLGMAPAEGSQDVLDALGEICNMVAGNVKVITGNDYSLHSLADSGALDVRLLFESVPIAITLQIHS